MAVVKPTYDELTEALEAATDMLVELGIIAVQAGIDPSDKWHANNAIFTRVIMAWGLWVASEVKANDNAC